MPQFTTHNHESALNGEVMTLREYDLGDAWQVAYDALIGGGYATAAPPAAQAAEVSPQSAPVPEPAPQQDLVQRLTEAARREAL